MVSIRNGESFYYGDEKGEVILLQTHKDFVSLIREGQNLARKAGYLDLDSDDRITPLGRAMLRLTQ
jgi:hypothetical protein